MDYNVLMDSILKVVVVLASLVITRYLVPWLNAKYGAEKVASTYDTILKAVKAAKKIYAASGQGVLRKEYVVKYIRDLGIDITDAELDMLIESAVKVLDILEGEINTATVKEITTETATIVATKVANDIVTDAVAQA